MNEDLLALIREYLSRTTEACRLLKTHLQLDNPMLWRERNVAQVGALGEGSRYAYHGTGVTVDLDGHSINFDFGVDGRCDGFSPWKLADLARQLGARYERFGNWMELREYLDGAVEEGWVHRPFLNEQDDLYYLSIEA
jgi:hypothetical protein